MPMMGVQDNLVSKPKWPKERVDRGLVTLNLAVASTKPNSIIRVVQTSPGVANGWIANTANIGNTAGTPGFSLAGLYIVNVSGSTIFLSQAPGNTLPIGTIITFSDPIGYKAGHSGNSYGYNANTVLVSSTRMSNANSILESAYSKLTKILVQPLLTKVG